MRFKRSIATLSALCVLVAPAAIAATTASTGGEPAPQAHATARAAAAAQRARALRAIAARRNVRLARLIARHRGERLPAAYARRARARHLRELQRSNYRLRRQLRALRRQGVYYRAAFRRVPRGTLQAIARCESGGNPRAIGGGGRYRGLFQMTFAIWGAVGGQGDPAAATPAEQYYRAALVYARYGSGQWPVCGR